MIYARVVHSLKKIVHILWPRRSHDYVFVLPEPEGKLVGDRISLEWMPLGMVKHGGG